MTQNTLHSRRTVAIIISYNSSLENIRKILLSLSNQCSIVIVDNGSTQTFLSALLELISKYDNVQLLYLEKNMGIAHAQNIGIRHVIDTFRETEFVFLLDHDSIPGNCMVEILEAVFSEKEDPTAVAAAGPALYDPRDNKYLDFHKVKFCLWGKIKVSQLEDSGPTVHVDSLNSSGSLVSLDVFRDVGEFDAGLFIDHVETDWCFRAKYKGYKLIATSRTKLTHHMGDEVCNFWLFGKKRMPYRSPSRHYYIVRNSILLQKRKYVPISWKFSNILKLCFTFIYFGIYCADSFEQRKHIVRGFIDGLRGVTGASSHQ